MSSFHHHFRRVVSPDLPLPVRSSSLFFCVHKLAMLTLRGMIVDGDFKAFRDGQRDQLFRRYGIEAASSTPEQMVSAASFLYSEHNKLRRAEQILERRRVSQKMQGRRLMSESERLVRKDTWEQAITMYKDQLAQLPCVTEGQ